MQILERRVNPIVRKITEGAKSLVQIINRAKIDKAERILKGPQYITPEDRSNYKYGLFFQYHGMIYSQLIHRVPTDSPSFINEALFDIQDIIQQINLIPDTEIDKILQRNAVDILVGSGLACRWPRK